jgi:hypothetical protein
MRFSDLEVTFRVDEDMENYLEIYNWMVATGFPENFDQYKGPDPSNRQSNFTQKELVSDATLVIHDSKMNPKTEIIFKDIFPIQLSELKFDTRSTDVIYIDATVTFTHSRFNMKSL